MEWYGWFLLVVFVVMCFTAVVGAYVSGYYRGYHDGFEDRGLVP